MNLLRLCDALVVWTALVGAAGAQEWPAHPLRIIVPFPAGGSADVQSRLIAEALAGALGQPVVVDNRPGAGGNLGAAAAAHAAPDGYTLFLATTGTHASNISLYKTLPFDPVKDFAPLTLVTVNPQVIAAGPAFAGLDLAGVIARLKSGGAASYGSSGIGSATHLAGALFARETATALTHVPYRGQGPALNDLLGGRIEMMFPLVADVLSFVQGGKVNAVAIMDTRRAAALPDVPTTAELGLPRIALTPIWTALYTNAGVPAPIVERLHRELVKIIASPAFVEKLAAAGYATRTSTPEELAALAAAETVKWAELVKGLGVQLE